MRLLSFKQRWYYHLIKASANKSIPPHFVVYNFFATEFFYLHYPQICIIKLRYFIVTRVFFFFFIFREFIKYLLSCLYDSHARISKCIINTNQFILQRKTNIDSTVIIIFKIQGHLIRLYCYCECDNIGVRYNDSNSIMKERL